jgi:hypothetical protein
MLPNVALPVESFAGRFFINGHSEAPSLSRCAELGRDDVTTKVEPDVPFDGIVALKLK